RLLYDILLELEENLEANSATDSVRCRGRPFTLLPICSHDTKYITVDKRVLKGLLRRVGGLGGKDPDFLKGESSVLYWDMYFFVQKSETEKKKFSYTSVKTDGKGVSVVLQRE
ncbi:unnamed protein product, partial [Laminaria digitata]